MKIFYKIISADENVGSVDIEYYTDKITEPHIMRQIHIPIVDGEYLNGYSLEKFILSMAPRYDLERKHAKLCGLSFNHITEKVGILTSLENNNLNVLEDDIKEIFSRR